jgi:hypothetical protein
VKRGDFDGSEDGSEFSALVGLAGPSERLRDVSEKGRWVLIRCFDSYR